jgi:hypothetical protein
MSGVVTFRQAMRTWGVVYTIGRAGVNLIANKASTVV